MAAEEQGFTARSFGSLLRGYRGQTGLTQEELAERAGLTAKAISMLERGARRAPRASTIELLAQALKLDPDQRERLVSAACGRSANHPTDSGRLRASEARPQQLPLDVRGFTGRSHHVRRLNTLLANGQAASAVVVTVIAGMAGVGKTALAVHWAHRTAAHFPDGQLFVDLRGYSRDVPISAVQALSLLLHGLGVEGDRVPIDADAAAGLYRSLVAGRRMLVVLDNARDAAQVRPLLPGTAGSMVVVTSRDRLSGLVASHGAHMVPVAVLEPEESLALVGEIAGARRVAAEPGAAAELTELCSHLPLALRIAAANLADQADLSIHASVAMLRPRGRLGRLEVAGDADVAVGAAFDCSYAALTAPARRLFRRLALAPGASFDELAAAALVGMAPDQTTPLLAQLAAAHLLERPSGERYGMHDLVRQYALERARADDGEAERLAAFERLSAWYLMAVGSAARLLYPHVSRLPAEDGAISAPAFTFEDRTRALAWLDTERASLVALVSGAAERGLWRTVWLLGDWLRGYFMLRRHVIDWLAVARACLDAAVNGDDLRAQAAAQQSMAMAYSAAEHHRLSVEHYLLALDLTRRVAFPERRASILGGLGLTHWQMGDLVRARSLHSRAHALYRRLGLEREQAATLVNLARLNGDLGRLERARNQLSQALALSRRCGARLPEANSLFGLGDMSHKLGRPDVALEYLTAAVPLYREVGYRSGELRALSVTAGVQRDTGRYPQAVDAANAALSLAREAGDYRGEEAALTVLGTVDLRLGRVQRAIDKHRRSLALARRAGLLHPEASSLLGLAAAHLHEGRQDRAQEAAERALAIARRTRSPLMEGDAYLVLSAIGRTRGQPAVAGEQAQRALALHRGTGYHLGRARALAAYGSALSAAGDTDGAQAAWHEALSLFDGVGAPEREEMMALLQVRAPEPLSR